MDLSSVLAYKSLFLANRASHAAGQYSDGQKYTSAANGARCAITASQGIIPLFAVSKCLSQTATNQTIKEAATKLSSNNNLQYIASAMTADTTKSALQGISKITGFLAKLGLVGNIAYAAAKCLDANEDNKTRVFMQATGNCAGMYLFEHIYSDAVKNIQPDTVAKEITSMSKGFTGVLKKIKPKSVLLGVGFVIASLFGCFIGEKIGDNVYAKTAKPIMKSSIKSDNISSVTNIKQMA